MNKIQLSVISLLFMSIFSQAEPIEETIKVCNDCHGTNGVSVDSDIPTIAGFSDITIIEMFAAYADETRPAVKSKYRHGDTSRAETDMITIAKELSEEQVEELATHYSEQTFVAATQEFNAELAAKGNKIHEKRCTKCHEDGGSSPDDDAAILAGQWMPYLEQSFKDYRDEKRETEEKMLKAINKLSDQQVEALIHYYSSLQ